MKLLRRARRARRTVEIRVADPGGAVHRIDAESAEGRRLLAAAQAVLRAAA